MFLLNDWIWLTWRSPMSWDRHQWVGTAFWSHGNDVVFFGYIGSITPGISRWISTEDDGFRNLTGAHRIQQGLYFDHFKDTRHEWPWVAWSEPPSNWMDLDDHPTGGKFVVIWGSNSLRMCNRKYITRFMVQLLFDHCILWLWPDVFFHKITWKKTPNLKDLISPIYIYIYIG